MRVHVWRMTEGRWHLENVPVVRELQRGWWEAGRVSEVAYKVCRM